MNLLRQTPVARFLALALLSTLPACNGPTPSGPNGFLTGKWITFNPAGSFELDLQAEGGLVKGTALDVCCIGLETHGTVTGTYGGGGFTLQLSFPKAANWFWMGNRATWTGHLSSALNTDELVGPLTVTVPVDSLLGTFGIFREPTQ